MPLDVDHITDLQLDALREVGNIGAGHAATSLAELLGEGIDITVPNAGLLKTSELSASQADPDAMVAGVVFEISGQAGGVMMYVFG